MFKGKRFKSQHLNQAIHLLKEKQQIITASSHLQIIHPFKKSLRHQSKSARKLSLQKPNRKGYSLQPHNNPEEAIQNRLKRKCKNKKLPETMQDKKIESRMANSNIGFKLKIRQSKQKVQVSPIMRIIVIDWLMQLVHELSLSKQALHHSIQYLDQLLNKINIGKHELQIYALCCLMIAQKLQSQRFLTPFNASELLRNQISEKDFICLQQQIVRVLEFKLRPFTLWVEIHVLLQAFQSYFKHQLNQQWELSKHRILWMVQGIIMQNSYFQNGIMQKQVCLSLLYLTVNQYNPNLTKYFFPFCNSLKGGAKLRIQSLHGQLKYASIWLSRRCECVQIYSEKQYHTQLKVLAASSLYN